MVDIDWEELKRRTAIRTQTVFRDGRFWLQLNREDIERAVYWNTIHPGLPVKPYAPLWRKWLNKLTYWGEKFMTDTLIELLRILVDSMPDGPVGEDGCTETNPDLGAEMDDVTRLSPWDSLIDEIENAIKGWRETRHHDCLNKDDDEDLMLVLLAAMRGRISVLPRRLKEGQESRVSNERGKQKTPLVVSNWGERTLEQALDRAEGLRVITEFRDEYSDTDDQDYIVVLADEIKRLQTFIESAESRGYRDGVKDARKEMTGGWEDS